MAFEISDAMYAGLAKLDSGTLTQAAKDAQSFNDLLPTAIDSFKKMQLTRVDLSVIWSLR